MYGFVDQTHDFGRGMLLWMVNICPLLLRWIGITKRWRVDEQSKNFSGHCSISPDTLDSAIVGVVEENICGERNRDWDLVSNTKSLSL